MCPLCLSALAAVTATGGLAGLAGLLMTRRGGRTRPISTTTEKHR